MPADDDLPATPSLPEVHEALPDPKARVGVPPEEEFPAPPDDPPDRRRFLGILSASLSAAIGAILAVPTLGFLFSPAPRRRDEVWSPLGSPDDFPLGETVGASFVEPHALPWGGMANRTAVWVRRTGPESFAVFSAYCTHVGCPVRWDGGARLFLCPCHGGAYYEDGTVAAGPPPRPLVRHQVRLTDGVVEILTRPIRLPRA